MSTHRTSLGARLAAGALTLGLGTIISAPLAVAHDAVIGGNPADGEVVDSFPTTVTLDFSGVPKEGFNTIAISDQDQNVLFTGEPKVEGQSITIDLPNDLDPGDGDYTIGFQITSSDGHATRGKTTFTVGEGGASDVVDGTASSSEPTEDSFNPTVAILGSLAAILAVGAAIVMVLKRGKTAREL